MTDRSSRGAQRKPVVTAVVGFASLVVLLALGMAFSIHSLHSKADEQVLRTRREEREIALVERLRWLAALIVADGRGYLLTGEPTDLAQVQASKRRFNQTFRTFENQELSPGGRVLADASEQAARRFMRVQEELLEARQRSRDTRALSGRFEAELLPLDRELEQSLDRLLEHKESVLTLSYKQAKQARIRLATSLSGLLVILVAAAVGIAWHFSTRLGRSFRREEDALRAARAAIAARDELMAVVAHDLRNPLGAIAMTAALSKKASDCGSVRRQMESIENVAMRMGNLINTMLDVTTLEAGKFRLNVAACAAGDVVQETVDMFSPLAASKQIRMEEMVKEPRLAVQADRDRLLQVLSNLVGNALKFTAQGGRVTLSVERRGGLARFDVLDTGPGISREDLARVFERYWRGTPAKKGTGLGLFIAKGIIDAHGGTIGVDSEPARGTRFFFTLRLASSAEQEVASVSADSQLRGS